jgi:hypothetical protein
MKSLDIPVEHTGVEALFMFLDVDGTNSIEYPEFLRKMRRAGVKIRKAEEEAVY